MECEAAVLSGDNEFKPVLRKEFSIRRNPICGEFKWLSLKRLKTGFHGLVIETRLEARGKHEAQFVIEADQPLVEGGVVEGLRQMPLRTLRRSVS